MEISMLKIISFLLVLGISTAQAQVRTIPPLNESDMTGGNPDVAKFKRKITAFEEKTSAEIHRCTNGASKKQEDFLALYNYISLKVDELDKKPACENDFMKCLATEDFTTKISEIIEHDHYVDIMKMDKKISGKQARQMRKFYRRLIVDMKAK